MATIGLDKLYYAPITEDANGNETYGTPAVLAKAISAELSVELNEAILYADDGAAEVVKEFKSGTLSLGIDDIGAEIASALSGATIDSNGVVVSGSDDGGTPTGCTVSSSASPPPTFRRRATQSASRRPPSKARSCAATRWTITTTTRGKRKSRKALKALTTA